MSSLVSRKAFEYCCLNLSLYGINQYFGTQMKPYMNPVFVQLTKNSSKTVPVPGFVSQTLFQGITPCIETDFTQYETKQLIHMQHKRERTDAFLALEIEWRLGLVFNFAANGTNLNYSTRLSIQIFSLLIINRLYKFFNNFNFKRNFSK